MEIIAHRGASHDAPENTRAAVGLAWAQGADAVEVDVHLTRDDRLAVIHDPDTRRTTGAAHVVGASDLPALQALDAGRWKGAAFAGETIPAVDDVLALVPAGRRIYVELKGGPASVPALVRALARSRLAPDQVTVISFNLETARAAKRQLGRCAVLWIVEADSPEGRRPRPELIAAAQAAGLDGLDLEAAWVDEHWVKLIRAAGLKVCVWTVDDAPLARRLAGLGVDAITTNRPGTLREQLGILR